MSKPKKMFKHLTIIKIFVLLVLTSGCTSSSSIPTYKVSSLFKSYCLFETGSYWVFSNETAPSTDTIRVGEVNTSTRFNPATNDYRYEAIEMSISNNPLSMETFEITAGNTQVEAGHMNSLLRLYLQDGSYFLIFSPQYPIGEEIPLGETIGQYTNVEIIPTYTLNNKTYSDVYHTQVIMNSLNTEYHYYIAKNHGLIRYTVKNETTEYAYSIVNSSLIQ